MSRSFRLTRCAEANLVEIAKETTSSFGPKQTDAFEAELLERWQALLNSQAHTRS
ncbi:hypothetical protein [Roseovarius spongiae]|uniref:hypothetical protein n=1 Tax=Roseovarius spongiae TaxID=2320272 RepID=UPI001FEB4E17|nr:hypothetical protein [Roseovarius spongiae]